MDKTVNINLGGSLFQVDEEAFTVLRDYLQAINNRFRHVPDGPETIEDIESRIAEIFRSQKGIAGVITRQNVESMIAIIGKPEDFDNGTDAGEPLTDQSYPKRLFRNPEDSVISGVCGGLGAYLNTDPVLFRILFIIFAFFGGAGILIYLVLWIAVPSAVSDMQKREMYGKSYLSKRNADGTFNRNNSAFSNGLNEVIRAFGKVFYVIFRIILIIFGTSLVLTGFLSILTFMMVFVFKIPDAFTHHDLDFSISYLPNMLDYIFSPAAAPWIWALSIIVFMLPMIALIYWGVKMIFWFKVRDGIFNLSMLLVWVIALAALSILIFNEGVSFAEQSSVTSRNILPQKPDTLYVVSGNKIDNLDFDEEFITPDNEYSVFFADSGRNLFIKPRLRFSVSEENSGEVEVRKFSSGRNRRDANEHAESIIYNYETGKDSVILDEYFMIPSTRKWNADQVRINVRVPENTVLYMDRETAGLLGNRIIINGHGDEEWEYTDSDPARMGGRYWKLTDSGLEEVGRKRPDKK